MSSSVTVAGEASRSVVGNDESYSLRSISRIYRAIGVAVALSALVVNPWTGALYRGDIVNYRDAMLYYFYAAVLCAAMIVGCSVLLGGAPSKWSERVAMLVLVISAIVLSDRLLLARYGLPLWIADAENHFKHRPNSIRKFEGDGALIRINRYGFHDDDFPLEKSEKEFRALMLGDSITMGHGVTHESTYSNQLESVLNSRYRDRRLFQVINAGVQGYATFQEYNVLLNSLKFEPDFIAIQFCLNDLTEPLVVETKFGGTGIPYHGVTEGSSSIASFLINETGYGRVAQKFANRGKRIDEMRRREVYDTIKAAGSSVDDPTFSGSWASTLSHLERIYTVAKERNTRVLLIISPHTFQFLDDRLLQPQKILTAHARSNGVDVLDLTSVFRPLIVDDATLPSLREHGFSIAEIEALYEARMKKYFLDQDHYTVEGHRIVAGKLFDYLNENYTF